VLELRWPDVKLLPRFHPSDEVAPQRIVSVTAPPSSTGRYSMSSWKKGSIPSHPLLVPASKDPLDDLHVLPATSPRPVSRPPGYLPQSHGFEGSSKRVEGANQAGSPTDSRRHSRK